MSATKPHQGTAGEPNDVSPLVSFILVAEFDVDKGSFLKAQYPRDLVPPPPSELISDSLSYPELVANMMHPDGAQRQEWDHNCFLLHRPKIPLSKDATEEWELLEDKDSKSIDLSNLMTTETTQPPENTLYALNCITCNRNANVKRGATVLAVAILSEYPALCLSDGQATGLIPLLRKLLTIALEAPEATVELIAQLYRSLNNMQCNESYQIISSIPDLRFSSKPFFLQSSITFQFEDFPLCLPIDAYSRSFSAGSILNLIRRFGFAGVIQLYHAILLEDNVLFVGYGIESSVLCNVVISCSLLAPMIDSLMTERIFPYVNLNDFTFTQTKGYIAGTNNPVLKDSCSYNLLVDLETNTLFVPDKSAPIPTANRRRHKFKAIGKNILEETTKIFQAGQDEEFRRKLEIGVLQLRCNETWVRRQFMEYTTMLTEICLGSPEIPVVLYESYVNTIEYILPTQWYKRYLENSENQPNIIRRINSAVRHIWYPLHGFHVAKDRPVYICPALEQLIGIVEDDYTLLLVAQRLIFYFGNVDLSDAIEFVQLKDYTLLQAARQLNVKLLALYADSKILMSLQCTTYS